ncbi:MAG: DUF3828 domain-containing protein [Rhizomicrobium sp.]|jgi:hypothetical protein
MTMAVVRTVCAAFSLLAISSAGFAASSDSPESFLRHLYAQYAPGKRQVAFDYPDAGSIVDASMLALLHRDQQAAKGEVGALDYDPICQCQDWEALKVVSVRVISSDDQKATADVTFDNGTGKDKWRQTVRFELVHTSAGWKIHDIRSKDAASLQALLRAAKY